MTFLQKLLVQLLPILGISYSPPADDGLTEKEMGELVRECRATRVENAFLKAELSRYGQTPTSLTLRLKVYKQQLKAAVRAS